jgi:hypothetical protein
MTGLARSKPMRLPSKFGWILRFGSGGGLPPLATGALAETPIPEAGAFVAAVPQAGRIIRSLWHMLALELPPALRLPKPPRRQPQGGRKGNRLLPVTQPVQDCALPN